jgi:hypothetical protein
MIVSLLTPSQPAPIDSNGIRVRTSSHRFRLFTPYPIPDSEPQTSPDLNPGISPRAPPSFVFSRKTCKGKSCEVDQRPTDNRSGLRAIKDSQAEKRAHNSKKSNSSLHLKRSPKSQTNSPDGRDRLQHSVPRSQQSPFKSSGRSCPSYFRPRRCARLQHLPMEMFVLRGS